MRIFIAEKPKMGQAIAKQLKGPHLSKDGYIQTSEGIVTWCIGHLLSTAPPDAYDPKYASFPWKFEDLPIIPSEWKLEVSSDKSKQVKVIKDLLKSATEVVNAGDPGREGQLIVDELLHYLHNKKPVKRILLNSLDAASIQKELSQLHDNKIFDPLYMAGLGRQRADWLVGMNMSRAYTILGKQNGFQGVLSVGRVQTPTLAIVVNRDREIETFKPIDYWTIKAEFSFNSSTYTGTWLAPGQQDLKTEENEDLDDELEDSDDQSNVSTSSSKLPWLDESFRIIDGNIAQSIIKKIKGQPSQITTFEQNRVEEKQPAFFDLLGIQVLANNRWGASAQETLDACQNLYEKGFTSYPRTDCTFMPESQHSEAEEILEHLKNHPKLSSHAAASDAKLKSYVWSDKKMEGKEHHAIIPTRAPFNPAGLSDLEQKIYFVIAQHFIAHFHPLCIVDKTKIITTVQSERFLTRGRIVASPGWRTVFGQEQSDNEDQLPNVKKDDLGTCSQVFCDAKKTQPPPHFTQASLLKAMKNVYTLVSDPALKKKLKSVEGIGRSATRASIIETLIKRKFVEVKSKQLLSTPTGQALIDALPDKLINPALTAMWESGLDSVAQGKTSLDNFMSKQVQWLNTLVDTAKTSSIKNLPSTPNNSSNISSNTKTAKKGKKCPKCNIGTMVERTIKNGPKAGKKFHGCSNYPNCNHSEFPK